MWMKSLETGEWFHLATFKFPAELTGFNYMGGFHERFTPRASLKSAITSRSSSSNFMPLAPVSENV